jgi:hypothetical protein
VASATDRKKKAALGQFMTPSAVAKFMAGLMDVNINQHVSLLDAGAGLGVLTCAFLERFEDIRRVSADLIELDDEIIPHLDEVMSSYRRKHANISIRHEDYIEVGAHMAMARKRLYTHVILNPPYKKIAATSRYRQELRRAGLEAVNLYAGFVGLAIESLVADGQMVVIMPRSFANGPYYLPFRRQLLERCSIRRMHLFDARDIAFKDDAVLQETIIIHMVRDAQQGAVVVSRSTDASFSDMDAFEFPFEEIVRPNDPDLFIHMPSNGQGRTLEQSLRHPSSLDQLGLKVSTGPVVDFRLREHLRPLPEDRITAPLLYPTHFRDLRLEWPVTGKKPNAIVLDESTAK